MLKRHVQAWPAILQLPLRTTLGWKCKGDTRWRARRPPCNSCCIRDKRKAACSRHALRGYRLAMPKVGGLLCEGWGAQPVVWQL
jgi:hypothetical protein